MYRLPSDCLMPRAILPDAHVRRHRERIPFAVASDDGGPVLVTDKEAATLTYTRRLIDPIHWPTWFHDLLAWTLAKELAMPLAVDPRLVDAVERKADKALVLAAQRNGAGQQPVRDSVSSAFVDARGGAAGDPLRWPGA
jgi:hypothetical protein